MSLCFLCGSPTEDIVHDYHFATLASGWAESNRIRCDLIHRHIVPQRLSERDRADDLPPDQGEAA